MNTSTLSNFFLPVARAFIRAAAVFSIVITRTLSRTKDNRRYTSTMSIYRFNVFTALTLVIMSILVELGSTQSGLFSFGAKRQSTVQKYCGKNLSNALQLICNGHYNSMFKKDGQGKPEAGIDDYPFDYVSYPFQPVGMANAMISLLASRPFRRVTRGAFDECCTKACSIQELYTYCSSTQ